MIKGKGHCFSAQTDQRIVFQLRECQSLAAQRSERFATDKNLPEGFQTDLLQGRFCCCWGGDYGEVDLAVFDGTNRLRCGVVVDLEPYVGIGHMEMLQSLQQINTQRSLAGTDGDAAVFQAGAFRKLLLCQLQLCHGCGNPGVEPFPLRSQADAAVCADEQRAPDLTFQTIHGAGNVRLAVAEYAGSLSQIAVFGNIIKNLIIFKINVHENLRF